MILKMATTHCSTTNDIVTLNALLKYMCLWFLVSIFMIPELTAPCTKRFPLLYAWEVLKDLASLLDVADRRAMAASCTSGGRVRIPCCLGTGVPFIFLFFPGLH